MSLNVVRSDGATSRTRGVAFEALSSAWRRLLALLNEEGKTGVSETVRRVAENEVDGEPHRAATPEVNFDVE